MNQFPKPMGQYQVGTIEYDVTDYNREDVNGQMREIRKLPVKVFYPAQAEGAEAEKYLSRQAAEAVVKMYRCKAFEEDTLRTYCYRDAVPVEGSFPVVIYNHGLNGYVQQNTVLCSDLASMGYIVVSISHPGEAAAVKYEDGSYDFYDTSFNKRIIDPMFQGCIEQMKIFKSKDEPKKVLDRFNIFQKTYCRLLINVVSEWDLDSVAVLDDLEKKNQGDWLLSGKMLLEQVGAIGHSLGGSTALHLLSDRRVACAVNMDGAVFGDHSGNDFGKPTLTIGCLENRNVELGGFLHNSAPSFLVYLDDMKHVGFMDVKYFPGAKRMIGAADPELVRKIVSECHHVFLHHYLVEPSVHSRFPEYPGVHVGQTGCDKDEFRW